MSGNGGSVDKQSPPGAAFQASGAAPQPRLTAKQIFYSIVLPHLVEILRLESESLYFHSCNVANLSTLIAKRLEIPNADFLKACGFLHDIGKLAVPDEILKKPAKLDAREQELVFTHPLRGHEILISFGTVMATGHFSLFRDADASTSKFLGNMARVIRKHHELPDGSGYPDGLTIAQMQVEDVILAIADKVCAFMEERPYRPMTYPKETAIEKAVVAHDWGFSKPEYDAVIEAVREFRTVGSVAHHAERF